MRTMRLIALAAGVLASASALGFGANGHRAVGQIAENHLTPRALVEVRRILGDEPLARAATWPDDMRSAPEPFWDEIASNWHFVNVEPDDTYEASKKAPKGDMHVALAAFETLLKGERLADGPIREGLETYFGNIDDPARRSEVEAFALRFLIHIAGDLHQPLHTGYPADLGGNTIRVEFFGQKRKLHAVWDTDLVESPGLSFSEIARFADTADPDEVAALQAGEPIDWLHESLSLREHAYDIGDGKFGYAYVFENVPVIERQILKGGLRGAKLINRIFDAAGSASARTPAGPARTFRVVAMNDIYRTEGVDGRSAGGMARLRSLVSQYEGPGEDVLVLHAGDMLFPSTLSRRYEGEQMVDALNLLDGVRGRVDPHMFVTFGNHEFDKRAMRFAPGLEARIRESEFTWLGTNVEFVAGDGGRAVVDAPNLRDSALVEIGGVTVGLFSLTTNMAVPEYARIDDDYLGIARRTSAWLRRAGAEVVIAVTHLRASEDAALLDALGPNGPDAIFGGHEHNRLHRCRRGRCVVKADADARSVTVARVTVAATGEVDVDHHYVLLDETTIDADPAVAEEVERWLARFESEHCRDAGAGDGCLQTPLGSTRVTLVGEELEIRRYETNLGAFIARTALEAYADFRTADGRRPAIAFLNSGGIRLNQNIPAGSKLTEWDMMEMFQYPLALKPIDIDGATLQAVVDHAVEDWTGNGWWLQIAGFAFRHDTERGTATDLHLLEPDGTTRPVDPDERIVAVVVDYLLDTGGDQDGYTMLTPAMVLPAAGDPPELGDAVRAAIRAAVADGIAPERPGLVCSTDRPSAPCVLD